MKVTVVLVGTKYAKNIGACARAMANMGGETLILVSPACQVDSSSYYAAAGAQTYLDKTQRFSQWSDYIKFYPHSLRIGFTARSGKNRSPVEWEGLACKISDEFSSVHLVFGPEDHGLSQADLSHCHNLAHLSVYGEFKSLNLAQAVLLALYCAQRQWQVKTKAPMETETRQALDEDLLRKWLEIIGFHLDAPYSNAFTHLNKYFKKNWLTPKEKSILEKALQQSLRKAKK